MAATDKTTQDFVPVQAVREGVLTLKSGSLCMVLIASSINFALKSADEQQALVMQYQNFLNSLDFHIQIFIQSRKLDIRPYLHTLEDRLKDQTNDLIKMQIREYMEFIKNFNDATNIMTKNFFIAVPYTATAFQQQKPGFFSKFMGGKRTAVEQKADFTENKIQLEQRASVVSQGLDRIGIRTALLGTEELVELLFREFNPGENDIPAMAK